MAILTLTPYRCAPIDSFEEGCYAYAYADGPVRLNGELITPSALHTAAGAEGMMSFELTPSALADQINDFSYTVAAFDPEGSRIWIHNIVMPSDDKLIYDLVPQEYDLDDHEFIPQSCFVYCGIAPVVPTLYGIKFESPDSDVFLLEHLDDSPESDLFDSVSVGEEFFVQILAIELYNSVDDGPSILYAAGTADYPYSGNRPSLLDENSNVITENTEGLVVGAIMKLRIDSTSLITVVEIGTTVIADAEAAKTIFDACIADGGVAGTGE